MKNTITSFLVLFFLIFTAVLKAENGQMLFVAELHSDNQIPPLQSDAIGLVTFLLSEDGKKISVHGSFSDLSGAITGCHIHLGDFQTNGPVIINLMNFVSGNRIKGELVTPPDFLANALYGDFYVNVHTALNPNGEIRGQLNFKSELLFPIVLQGINELPQNGSTGIGLGVLRFSNNLTRFNYQVFYTGLTGPPTGAHIHKGDNQTNGPVLVPLVTTNIIQGDVTDEALVFETFINILDSGAYVNIHTAEFPNGEIRGQILYPEALSSSSILNGSQETPPVNSTANAYGYSFLNYPTFDSLFYIVLSEGITATNAHIHRGPAGTAGPVVVGLTSIAPGIYSGTAALTDQLRTAYLKDELYFNIHSTLNPNGEIRGQLENNLMKSFAFDLCGDQENPKKNIPAYAAAYVAVNKSNTELEYSVLVNDLTGEATAAHFHGAAFGQNGSVILPIDVPKPYATGVLDITGTIASKIDMDGAYMNVHTVANSGGEIRGQVRRSLSCDINTGLSDLSINDIKFTQGQSNDLIYLQIEADRNMDLNFDLLDINGNLVYNTTQSIYSGVNQVKIDVQNFTNGFYFLQVNKSGKMVKNFKWIIANE
ncbi:MAG: CHRD domain-containing protein [Saprospiraceae bacterium]